MGKCSAALLLFVLVYSSTAASGFIGAATAQPSVPEFTLKSVVTPFTIPPASTINPYTGENQSLSPGFRGETRSVTVSVKNQPFSPYCDANGDYIELYYNVSFKGHYSDVWAHYPDSTYLDLFNASSSEYTVIPVSLEPYPSIPRDGELDFRLQAIIGHYNYDTAPSGTKYVTGFTALETGDWSNTQTVAIDENVLVATPNPSLPSQSLSPTESQNPTPSQPSNQIVIQLGVDWSPAATFFLPVVIAVLLAVAVVLLFTRRKNKPGGYTR